MEYSSEESKSVEMIDIDVISENPFQPRKVFNEDAIAELSESIKTHGMLQPVILRNIGGRYQIVAGERRIRAAKHAGLGQVPAIIVSIDGVDVAEVSLIENIQRKNLNCIEEADAFKILKTKFGMTAEEIAKRIGKSRPYVSNILRLTSLPERVKDSLMRGDISMGHGRALLSVGDKELQVELFERIVRESLSVRQTEDMVAAELGGELAPKPKKAKKKLADSLGGDSLEFYNSLQAVVSDIKRSGGKAEVIERETDDFFEIVVRLNK